MKGIHLSNDAKMALLSSDFKPTSGITTKIPVLKSELFEEKKRTTKNIRALALKHQFTTPITEVACLVRDMFTDDEIKAMGLLGIITMHNSIKDSDRYLGLLGAHCGADIPCLEAYNLNPGCWWSGRVGFAFALPQASSQNYNLGLLSLET